jgi:hypothetical protein
MRGPAGWVADVLAVVIVGFYTGLCAWLILVGKGTVDDWDRHMKIYAALTPLAGAAVGWVFGREVNRQAAVAYRRDALRGRKLATAVKTAAELRSATRKASAPVDGASNSESPEPDHLDYLEALAGDLFSEK